MLEEIRINELFPEIGAFNIEYTVSDTRRTTYCEKTHRLTDEKYILTVNGKDVKIECSGEKSTFYAVCDLAKRVREGKLSDGEFMCAPAFAIRGYIEGFYGTPWTHDKRMSILGLMAKSRMNTVYYGPKDDLYHRELWRDLYPEDDLMKLKVLVDEAGKYFMSFCWCIAPGLSVKYSSEDEFRALTEKTKQLYSIGIRHFGLLLDDIEEDLVYPEDKELYGETVNAHIDLINRYHASVSEIDPAVRLTICPTVYHGKGNEYYITKLGQNISPLVSVFWTGRDICSREITSPEAMKFIEHTRHKPLYWDNYPVNDCAMFNEMHIYPIIGRDPDLYKYSEGIIANCMEYAECSKIPLITIADYLWDSENYNHTESWENAVRQIVGDAADDFIIFADHLCTSCLMDVPSARMYKAFGEMASYFKAGDKEKTFELADAYIEKMHACKEFLLSDHPICRELTKWSEKFFVAIEMTEKLFRYLKTNDEKLLPELSEIIDRYYSIPAKLCEDVDIRTELRHGLGIVI